MIPSPSAGAAAEGGPPSDLLSFLRESLGRATPLFVLVVGRVGAGKSTLIRSLADGLAGKKLFVAYQILAASAAAAALPAGTPPPPTPMLLVDPQVGTVAGDDPAAAPLLAFSPREADAPAGISDPLAESIERARAGGGVVTVLVDSWDRNSEAYFRSHARSPAGVRTFSTPASELLTLQSSIVSSPTHLVVGMMPELAPPLVSVADIVVRLESETTAAGPVGVASVAKARGPGDPPEGSLYAADGHVFRTLPPAAPGARPKIAAPEPDPDPARDGGWPGSAAFARAYGRLRFGGMTGVATADELPDTVPLCLVGPAVGEVLARGGRAVWIPSPEVRPARLLAQLREIVPDGWLRERLRILSASADDPTLKEFRTTLLPINRETVGGTGTADGVGPIFPSVHRFLREHPADAPALYAVSLEGLRAVLVGAGRALEPATLPSVAGAYTRIPRYHLFCHGNRHDPITAAMMPMADTVLQAELVHGRPVLFGVRPKRGPMVLEWAPGSPAYQLVPATV